MFSPQLLCLACMICCNVLMLIVYVVMLLLPRYVGMGEGAKRLLHLCFTVLTVNECGLYWNEAVHGLRYRNEGTF